MLSNHHKDSRRAPVIAMIPLVALLLSAIAPLAGTAAAQGSRGMKGDLSTNAPRPTRTIYIEETGHSIDGVFLDQWIAGGMAATWGNPITAEIQKSDNIVQYYQFARFEYWPNDPNGKTFQLGKLGYDLRPQVTQRQGIVAPQPGTFETNSDESARLIQAWSPLDASKYQLKPTTDSWRFIPETGHSLSNGFKAFWEAGTMSSFLGNPLTEEYVLSGVTYQVFEFGQLGWQKGKDPWLVQIGTEIVKAQKIATTPTPRGNLMTYAEYVDFMSQERWIDVDLTNQYLVAYQGDTPVLETYVSTGREEFKTPTGTFHVLVKIESQTMEGVLGGEEYHVPDVPWVMYFTDRGHAIHGAYWHNNFGTPMSHGCINLPVDVAQWMYYWAPLGMRIEIHY